MIYFEKEIIEYLHLPSIPKKEWNGTDGFKNGVAIVNTVNGSKAYAVASYDPDEHEKPVIVKVFGYEQFKDIDKVFIVPSYMDTDVDNYDVDEESKRRAAMIAKDAAAAETTADCDDIVPPENEYYFDNIHNDEEARAFIDAYNKRNNLKRARVPKNHEGLVMRLSVIYNEENSKQN